MANWPIGDYIGRHWMPRPLQLRLTGSSRTLLGATLCWLLGIDPSANLFTGGSECDEMPVIVANPLPGFSDSCGLPVKADSSQESPPTSSSLAEIDTKAQFL